MDPLPGKVRFWAITSLLLICSAWLLLANLGHYALWDDETYTALGAKGVLATGDTSAVIGHNIVGFRGGIMLKNLRDRFTPPLPTYLAAISFILFGVTPYAARLPFALCGLAAILLGILIAKRQKVPGLVFYLTVIAILGNTSFYLYCRQSRYYGIVLLCAVAIGYLYFNWQTTWRHIVLFAILSIGLFASNSIAYFQVYLALAVDYLLWGKSSLKLRPVHWLVLLGIQGVGNAIILSIWNPLATHHGSALLGNNLLQKGILFFWNLRDINACEFGVGALLLAAPFVYFKNRNPIILRCLVAMLVCIGAACLVSPQPVAQTTVADIRYILPVIPLCILLEVLTLKSLSRGAYWIAIPVALVAFHTNFLNGGLFTAKGLHSSSLSLCKELISPPSDPYTEATHWIERNVKDDESIWVLPDYMTYPLMFSAPKAVYAWQLTWPPEEQFKGLPLIHFAGKEPPNYILAFGPVVQEVERTIQSWKTANVSYSRISVIDYFWKDMYRPELFWRQSSPIVNFNKDFEAIYVFRREN